MTSLTLSPTSPLGPMGPAGPCRQTRGDMDKPTLVCTDTFTVWEGVRVKEVVFSYRRSWMTSKASLSRKTDLSLFAFGALGNGHGKNKTALSSSCISHSVAQIHRGSGSQLLDETLLLFSQWRSWSAEEQSSDTRGLSATTLTSPPGCLKTTSEIVKNTKHRVYLLSRKLKTFKTHFS